MLRFLWIGSHGLRFDYQCSSDVVHEARSLFIIVIIIECSFASWVHHLSEEWRCLSFFIFWGLLSLLLPAASWHVFVFPFPPILEACSRFFSSLVVSETQGWGGESSLQASSRGALQPPPPPPPPEIKKKKWRNTTESAMAPEFCGRRHVHVTHHMQGVQEGRKRFFCLSAHMGKLPPSSREGKKKSTQKNLKKDKHFFVSQRLTLSAPSVLLFPSLSLPLACLLPLLLL